VGLRAARGRAGTAQAAHARARRGAHAARTRGGRRVARVAAGLRPCRGAFEVVCGRPPGLRPGLRSCGAPRRADTPRPRSARRADTQRGSPRGAHAGRPRVRARQARDGAVSPRGCAPAGARSRWFAGDPRACARGYAPAALRGAPTRRDRAPHGTPIRSAVLPAVHMRDDRACARGRRGMAPCRRGTAPLPGRVRGGLRATPGLAPGATLLRRSGARPHAPTALRTARKQGYRARTARSHAATRSPRRARGATALAAARARRDRVRARRGRRGMAPRSGAGI